MSTQKSQSRKQVVPFHTYLDDMMTAQGLRNVEVAERLGYKPNVIAMFRSGSMKVPPNKVKALAEILGVDTLALVKRAMSYYDPELWETLDGLLGDRLVTQNERAILEVIRGRLNGIDIPLHLNDEFVGRLEMMADVAFDAQVRGELAAGGKSTTKRDSVITRANAEVNALIERQAVERQELRKKLQVEKALSRAA